MKKKTITYQDVPLFDGIAEKSLEAMLHCLQHNRKEYTKGSYILLEEECVQYIGIVLRGRVHMLKEDIWGEQTLLTYMGPGEVFGETFALRKEQRSYVSYMAAEDCEIMFLALDKLLHPCPRSCSFHTQLSQNMYDLMGEKNIRLMERIEVASKSTLREKLLAYLSLQAQKQGARSFTVPLSRTEMAQYLQSNRSAMTRELSAMRAEGILDFDGNTFQLKE
ncbi:MAG: Crp/Fnr family transcriptional regulator [Lachnospiraceae bacterium]|nr:Crp/Fnr family transcriptional regulator [Lachnospiraceae bacterium]